MIKVNCKQADGYGFCNKKKRVFFKLFKPSCCEYESLSSRCSMAERYPRPKEINGTRQLKDKAISKVVCPVCGMSYNMVTEERICPHVSKVCTTCNDILQDRKEFKNRISRINELEVCIDLLNKGYEIFKNVCQTGSCDLIALKNGRTYIVEVTENEIKIGNEMKIGSTIKTRYKEQEEERRDPPRTGYHWMRVFQD